jgi:hypothetical protein
LIFAVIPAIARKYKELGWIVIGCIVISVLIPFIIFHGHFVDLTRSFFENQVFDPSGRVMTSADPTAVSNQGIDAVLLRYLSYVPSFHDASGFPHFNLSANSIIEFANFLRLVVVGVTFIESLRWLRAKPAGSSFMLMALWSAALYVILPGAKGRYAIYALPAIIVLIAQAHENWSQGLSKKAKKMVLLILAISILLLQIVPDYSLQFGIGLAGSVLLWLTTIKCARHWALASGTGQNNAARGERPANIL